MHQTMTKQQSLSQQAASDAAGSPTHQHCDADSEDQPPRQAPRLSNMGDSPEMPNTINTISASGLATFIDHKMDSQ